MLTSVSRAVAITLAVLLGLSAVGCDSGGDDDSENERSDADLFVGTWTFVSLRDSEADRSSIFLTAVEEFQLTFGADGSFTLVVTPRGQDEGRVEGTYTVDEDDTAIDVQTDDGSAFEFDYEFRDGDGRLALVAEDGAELASLFDLPNIFQGDVTLVVERES